MAHLENLYNIPCHEENKLPHGEKVAKRPPRGGGERLLLHPPAGAPINRRYVPWGKNVQ